jgi:hypothetical protein
MIDNIVEDFSSQGNVYSVYFQGCWLAMFHCHAHAEGFVLDRYNQRKELGMKDRLSDWSIKTYYCGNLPT